MLVLVTCKKSCSTLSRNIFFAGFVRFFHNFGKFWVMFLYFWTQHRIYFSLFYIINSVLSIYIYGCEDLPSSPVAQLVTVLHSLHEGLCSTPTGIIFLLDL